MPMTSNLLDQQRQNVLVKFGEMISNRRQSSRWTPRDIWEKTGVLPSTVSAVESGEGWPDDNDREKICEFLGIPVDTFGKMLRQATANKTPIVISHLSAESRSNIVNLNEYRQKDGEGPPHKGL